MVKKAITIGGRGRVRHGRARARRHGDARGADRMPRRPRRAPRARTRSRSAWKGRSPARSRRSATTSCTGRSSSPPQWNKTHPIKINIVQGDTQLTPSLASTVSQSFASNSSIVGVIGPAGSQEVSAAAPILKKAGLAFVSGSATNPALTNGSLKGYFFRVVPNDSVQGPTDADYMMKHLGVTKGSKVMIVDDQESYSTGLAGIVKSALTKAGVTVDSESITPEGHRLLGARREGRQQHEGRVHAVPARVADAAPGPAAQVPGQEGDRVRHGRQLRLVEVQPVGQLRVVLRLGRDHDLVRQGRRRRLPSSSSRAARARSAHRTTSRPSCTRRPRPRRARRARARSRGRRSARRSPRRRSRTRSSARRWRSRRTATWQGAAFHIFKIVNGKYLTIS